MRDEQLINCIDFMRDRGLGSGGFRFELPHYLFYNDQSVIKYLDGKYLNPLGPFKKEVTIYMVVAQKYKLFKLSYKTEFWGSCDQVEFINTHLRPFLELFRKYINNELDSSKLYGGEYRFLSKSAFPNYNAGTELLTEEKGIKEVNELFDIANYYKNQQ